MAKGDNAILPLYDDGDHLTCAVTAAVVGAHFVAPSGDLQSSPILNTSTVAVDGGNIQVATCGAGARALGVAAYDGPTAADKIHVYSGPGLVVPVIAGATVTAGEQVMSDSTGRAITFVQDVTPAVGAAAATKVPNGLAVSSATVGLIVYIRLY